MEPIVPSTSPETILPHVLPLTLLVTPAIGIGVNPPDVDVLVLICAHNRRDRTRAAIRGILRQQIERQVQLGIIVVDDGSTDGTSDAVVAECPAVEVIHASGDLFWSKAMALAQNEGLARATPRFLLWLNDDVVLMPDALQRLLETAKEARNEHVIVGALKHPDRTTTTYGAFRRTGPSPLRVELIEPSAIPQRADTFNGNVVLVPQGVYEDVGTIDGRFRHAYGDLDYGYRVRESGRQITLAPGHVGSCARNNPAGTWCDAEVSRTTRLRLLLGPKGLPPASHISFLRRHSRRMWPIFALGAYSRYVFAIIRKRSFLVPDEETWRQSTELGRTP